MADTTKFKEYLANELKDVQWKDSKKEKLWFWISLGGIVLGIFLFIIRTIASSGASNSINVLMILAIIVLVASGVGMIVSGTLWSSNRGQNKKNLFAHIPADIYQKYYDLTYPNNILKYHGFYDSERFKGYKGMVFSINDEYIWWDVKEHTEKRTRTYTDSKGGVHTTTYTVYILNYMIRLATTRLKGYEPITLTTVNRVKKLVTSKNPNEFLSSSIIFNQKYKVLGKNQLQVTKLFDPSVIDNFTNVKNPHFYSRHKIVIDNGFAYTKWTSGDSTSSWGANLNQFEYLNITRKNYVNEITARIENDFNRFLEVLYLFRPFDFYRIYQNKPNI